jgi:SAM-dependent methyltransferase
VISRIKQIAKRSKTGIVAYRIFADWRAGQRFNSGKIDLFESSALKRMTLPESLEYINRVFRDYLNYSDFSPDRIKGARVLEIGHGDNFGVALLFLAAGADQVICLDKFYSELDHDRQRELYTALRQQLDETDRRRFDTAISLDDTIKINPEKLKPLYGSGIEEAGKKLEPASFDLMISRAVLEYATDSDAAFSVMDQLLKSGGCMIHKIDLRDDGLFSRNGMHPLTFLTIPDSVYRWMTINSGRCNRKLINYYREKMSDLGYEVKLLITATLDSGELIPHKHSIELDVDYSKSTVAAIQRIRPKLSASYRHLPDEDLLIAGIFLIASKRTPAQAL